MKFKKLGLVILSLLLTVPAMARTTVTPTIAIESNSYDKDSKGNKEDNVAIGIKVTQSLTEKQSISIEHIKYDYDYFYDNQKTNSNRKEELYLYLNNSILKSREGLSLDVNIGTKREHYVNRGSDDTGADYRVQPRWKYPITKDITLGGNWLLYKVKNIDGRYDNQYGYQYGHELDTGITYTGIKNYRIDVSLYDEKHTSLMKDNDYDKHLMQLRTRISTKVGSFDIAPWFGIQLGDYKTVDKSGKEAEKGKVVNRYGVDVATVVSDVRYNAQVYTQTSTYDDKDQNWTRMYLRLSSTYSF